MIKTFNIDCLDYMSKIDDNFFNLGDADPPYFSGPEKRKFYGNSINKLNIKRIDYPVTDTWKIPDSVWFNEFKRVCIDWIIWGANYFDFIGVPFKTPRGSEINKFLEDNPIGWIIWDKCNGESSFNDYELAFTSFNQPTVIYKFMWNGMLQGKSMLEGHVMQGNKLLNQKRIHPTEKPIPLYDWQFYNYTKPGFKVFSPYAGSFSDAISAAKFNIDYYGCEKNIIHYNSGTFRLKQHQSQTKLF